MSQATKELKRKKNFFHLLSWILAFLPISIWFIIAMVKSTEATKTALALTLVVAVLFFFANLILKYHIRSTVWILLIGIYVALRNITPLLIIISVCTILDEFFATPMYKHYKARYKINKEIDSRMGVE